MARIVAARREHRQHRRGHEKRRHIANEVARMARFRQGLRGHDSAVYDT